MLAYAVQSNPRRIAGRPRLLIPIAAGHLAELAHVEASAKGPAFAREHDSPQTGGVCQFCARSEDAGEHRIVKGVHLVGAAEANIGNAVDDGY